MTSKIIQIIIKIITISLIFIIINAPEYRVEGYWNEIFNTGDNFIKQGKDGVKENGIIDDVKVKKESNKIYNILLTLGVVLSVIVGGILGIQIMWGSIEQQVKAKEMLMPYAIGCIVIFGAFGIWKICVTIFSQV